MTLQKSRSFLSIFIILFLRTDLSHQYICLQFIHIQSWSETMTQHSLILKNYRLQSRLLIQQSKYCKKKIGNNQYRNTIIFVDQIIIIFCYSTGMMQTGRKKAPPFLVKTYEMLQNRQFLDVINWNQEENGFTIADTDAFSSKVLPTFFKHSNIHSYIRQLNMYGFSKKRGKNSNYYYHPCFIKNKPELLCQIQRRVQNKCSKSYKTSTVSIQDHLPQQPQLLIKMNHLLLLQQISNLKIILDEIICQQVKQAFAKSINEYIEAQSCLLSRISGAKSDILQDTTGTLKESTEKIITAKIINQTEMI